MNSNIFLEKSIAQASRFLSLADRNSFSQNYGCFDRNFWHYKAFVDFPSAIFQQAALTLALLYQNNFDKNIFYKNQDILKLCLAAVKFWAKIQNRDGSFNEWYPHEHSFVATAFTTYAVSEAILLLKNEIAIDEKNKEALEKSGSWLCHNEDTLVLNHAAGAVVALYNLYLLTKNEKFKAGAGRHLSILEKFQNEEGWFPEYGGADLGYLSLTVDFLSKYYAKSKDAKALRMLEKALNFMQYFMHPDGGFGGEYSSRNTKFIFPHGLVLLAKNLEPAKYMLGILLKNIEKNNIVSLPNCDDRYLTFFFLPNCLQAGLDYNNHTEYCATGDFEVNFKNAGLFVKKGPKYYLVCSYRKNGALKIFRPNGEMICSDSGYLMSLKSGKALSSNFFNPKAKFSIKADNGTFAIEISSSFKVNRLTHPLRFTILPFRVFNIIFGRFTSLSGLFGKIIKKIMIQKVKTLSLFLARVIFISQDKITISDALLNKKFYNIVDIDFGGSNIFIHTPSSNYFIPADLTKNAFDFSENIKELNNKGQTCIQREFKF
jgi:hypothetical protein